MLEKYQKEGNLVLIEDNDKYSIYHVQRNDKTEGCLCIAKNLDNNTFVETARNYISNLFNVSANYLVNDDGVIYYDWRKEFYDEIVNCAHSCPSEWRFGQSVFNVLNQLGLARIVQFEKNIDCFYNDEKVDEFINAAFDLLL